MQLVGLASDCLVKPRFFRKADSVLSGDGALPLYNFGKQGIEHRFTSYLLITTCPIDHDIDVNIPIACMAETCHGNVIFPLKLEINGILTILM